jgi:hypothetical protein
MTTGFRSLFCHPEPGPEASSGSIDFGISVFGFKNLGFKAPSVGGVLYLGVKWDIVWSVIKDKMPKFKSQIENILKEMET